MLIGVSASAQLHIGGGYISSQDRSKSASSTDVTVTTMPGFYAGAGYAISLTDNFYVQPSLYFVQVSKKDASSFWIVSGKGDTREQYLNLPIDLGLKFDFAPGFRFNLFAGPTVSYGLSSVFNSSVSIGSTSIDVDPINNYDSSYDYGRFDVLVGGGAAVDLFNRVRVTARYDWGLLNRYTGDGNYSRHRNQLTAGVAILF